MLLKDLKLKFSGSVRTFKDFKPGSKSVRVFYMSPDDLRQHISKEDFAKIDDWNGICILSAPKGKANPCFYFYWGYGGNPDYLVHINIKE